MASHATVTKTDLTWTALRGGFRRPDKSGFTQSTERNHMRCPFPTHGVFCVSVSRYMVESPSRCTLFPFPWSHPNKQDLLLHHGRTDVQECFKDVERSRQKIKKTTGVCEVENLTNTVLHPCRFLFPANFQDDSFPGIFPVLD